jgi:hypothetical protein
MKILLKRDTQGESFPHADQLEVGELAVNAVTGKLYIKKVNGTIVEFVGQNICFEPTPEIYLEYKENAVKDQIKELCCSGDSLIYIVRNLRPAPKQYTFSLVELTNNNSEVSLATPDYSSYTETILQDNTQTDVTLRQALIPVDIIINKTENISIFKFIVKSEGSVLSESLISIGCEKTTQ